MFRLGFSPPRGVEGRKPPAHACKELSQLLQETVTSTFPSRLRAPSDLTGNSPRGTVSTIANMFDMFLSTSGGKFVLKNMLAVLFKQLSFLPNEIVDSAVPAMMPRALQQVKLQFGVCP